MVQLLRRANISNFVYIPSYIHCKSVTLANGGNIVRSEPVQGSAVSVLVKDVHQKVTSLEEYYLLGCDVVQSVRNSGFIIYCASNTER